MKVHSIFLALVFMLSSAFAFPSTRTHSGFDKEGLEVRITPFTENVPQSGYFPISVEVVNKAKASRTIFIQSTSDSSTNNTYGFRGINSRELGITSSYTLRVDPKQTKSFPLLIPVARAQDFVNRYSKESSNILLEVRSQGVTFFSTFEGSGGSKDTNIAFSPSVQGGSSTPSIQEERQFHTQSFPTRLKAIRGYSIFAMTISDLERLSRAQQSALVSWVGQGGYLIINENVKVKPQKAAFLSDLFAEARNSQWSHNPPAVQFKAGKIRLLKSNDLEKMLNKMENWENSSGRTAERFFTSGETLFSTPNHIMDDYGTGVWPLTAELGEKYFGSGLLCVFVILFVVVVGPLNFFVFAGPGRRHRLFITTPLISAAGSLLLLLFILISEGVGGRGHRLVHMELDPERSQAFLSQQQIVRNGVLFSTSFNLDQDYEIYQVPIDKSRWSRVIRGGAGVDESYTYKPQGDGTTRYTGNFFSSRSQHGHFIEGHKVTKEKITVVERNGSVMVSSTFKQPIKSVFIRHKDAYYTVNNLTAGKEVKALPSDLRKFREEQKNVMALFNGMKRRQIDSLMRRESCFVAVSDEMDGIDTLKGIRWRSTKTVITGDLTTL